MEKPTKTAPKPLPDLPEDEEEIIELTQVIEEGPSEVVLELASLEEELDSLDLGSLSAPEPTEAEAPEPPREELLPGLKEAEPPPAAVTDELMTQPSASFGEELEGLKTSFSEDQLREMVREVVQETVTKLAKELFPQIALEAVQREIEALKKAVAEEEASIT